MSLGKLEAKMRYVLSNLGDLASEETVELDALMDRLIKSIDDEDDDRYATDHED